MPDRLSTHFKRSEFLCKCGNCGQNTVDAELLTVLQWLRYETDKPITINSGNRCFSYNRKVGGSPTSYHVLSRASDITVQDMRPLEVFRLIDTWYADRLGLILYPNFVHIDSRTFKFRDVRVVGEPNVVTV